MERKSGTLPQLMTWLTEELATDDRACKFVINNSMVAKKLIEKGEGILPAIGTYLLGLDSFLGKQHQRSREQVEKGWVLLIQKIIGKHKSTEQKKVPSGFDDTRKWAAEYKQCFANTHGFY